ncbi:MAG: ester cyclase [Ilumatobacteraceae bacterium]
MANELDALTVRRFYEEVLNKRDLAVADEIFAADFIHHGLPPDSPKGVEGFKRHLAFVHGVFPDGQVTIDDMVVGDGKVVIRLTARGTQNGPFLGFPATGKQATWTGIDIMYMSQGKISECWSERDVFGMLLQLGLISPPG